jgi:predicted DCC family thiol-disulfide oxidoreductase YuxK
VSCLAFVPGSWLRRLVAGRPEGQPAGRVLYDGACPVCRASMALVMAADPDHVVAPVDLNGVDVVSVHPSLTREACLTAMHLVGRDGRVWAGFDAVVRLGLWLPLFWPMGWIGSIPGMALPGRALYNGIASRRRREGPCSDETCSLHRPSRSPDRVHPGPLEPRP